MRDPIGAFARLQDAIKLYITSAFGTDSQSFELERKALLDRPGVLFQEPYVEPLPAYASDKLLSELEPADLGGITTEGLRAFAAIAAAGLFSSGFPLYTHQRRMLTASMEGKHTVVVTGTGSGKTEAFLLPVIASIIREATTPEGPWLPATSPRQMPWSKKAMPAWDDSRRRLRGEARPAAIRALVLYPMNALVEDQVSRLRTALDSDKAHAAMDASLGGNRIRFGRYNGSTPISGHPFKPDRKPNKSARDRLASEMRFAESEYAGVRATLEHCRSALNAARASGEHQKVAEAEASLGNALDQASFVQRFEPSAGEMLHRWEMQAEPPDLLITNVSMLSIMLMRHADLSIQGDRADSHMFDVTREWLQGDRENRVFQLVVDELHLHRGAAGTEVAYLLRLLLERLGLTPDSPQLRILASSASLNAEDPKTFEFLGAFFGMDAAAASSAFHVESGVLRFQSCADPALNDDVAAECVALGREAELGVIAGSGANLVATLKSVAALGDKIYSAFADGRVQARPLGEVAGRLFPNADAERQLALRGLLVALGDDPSLAVPRLRFHWMVKNIEGLWALPRIDDSDARRRVGALAPEPTALGGERWLEVLYCECCGTQMLCGHKIALTAAQLSGHANPSGLPGLGGGAPVAYELTTFAATLEGVPEASGETRTDSQLHSVLGVVWLLPEDWSMAEPAEFQWRQGSVDEDDKGKPLASVDARWIMASIDATTGIVTMGNGPLGAGSARCLWFSASPSHFELSGMPERCPACSIDYSERRGGRRSPIRSFVTGLGRTSHLLTKHLMGVLPEGRSRKLVAFSDSREAAAGLAVGVDQEQWQHLLRVFLQRELRARARGGLDGLRRRLAMHLAAGTLEEAKQELRSARLALNDADFDQAARVFNAVRALHEDPELASASDRAIVEQALAHREGFVMVDEILRTPYASGAGTLTPVWRALVSMGVNPGGARLDERTLSGKQPRDWTSVFRKGPHGIDEHLEVVASLSDQPAVDELGEHLRKAAWRALSGRLLYDLEAQGLGYLTLNPSTRLAPPARMPTADFMEACNSVLRILTEERRTDPTQGEYPTVGWETGTPKGAPNEGRAKVRVLAYVSKVAAAYGVSTGELMQRVEDAFRATQHRAPDGGWGVVCLGHLWVFVVAPGDLAWSCLKCRQLHWHRSARVCSRCTTRFP